MDSPVQNEFQIRDASSLQLNKTIKHKLGCLRSILYIENSDCCYLGIEDHIVEFNTNTLELNKVIDTLELVFQLEKVNQ